MTIYKFPLRNSWPELLKRPAIDHSVLDEKVDAILLDVKKNGDEALRKYTAEFDKANLEKLEITDQEKDRDFWNCFCAECHCCNCLHPAYLKDLVNANVAGCNNDRRMYFSFRRRRSANNNFPATRQYSRNGEHEHCRKQRCGTPRNI